MGYNIVIGSGAEHIPPLPGTPYKWPYWVSLDPGERLIRYIMLCSLNPYSLIRINTYTTSVYLYKRTQQQVIAGTSWHKTQYIVWYYSLVPLPVNLSNLASASMMA